MEDMIRDLKSSLQSSLTQSQYDPNSPDPETQKVKSLANRFRGLATGDMDIEQIRQAFREEAPEYDLEGFLADWQERGALNIPDNE